MPKRDSVPRKLVLGWHGRVQHLLRCDAPRPLGYLECVWSGNARQGLPVPIFAFRQKTTQLQGFTVLTPVIPCAKVNWATLRGDQFRYKVGDGRAALTKRILAEDLATRTWR